MKKKDYLEILEDYLKDKISNEEIEDIIRDYEEYFIDGAIEGKSEDEIIASLGSPKTIADDLLVENGVSMNSMDKHINNFKAKFKENFKIDLVSSNQSDERKKMKIKKFLVTCASIASGFVGVGVTIAGALSIIGSLWIALLALPFIKMILMEMPELRNTFIFGGIAYVGLEMILIQLFIMFIKFEKRMVVKYKNFMGLTKKYLNASEIIEDSKK